MKVALCLSGQPRFFKQSFEYLKMNVLDLNDVDVFLHTWELPSSFKGCGFDGASWNQGRTDTYLGHEETVKSLIETYNPKGISTSVLDEIGEKDWNKYPLTNGENLAKVTHFMFYSMKKSVELVPDGYDIIIRSRYDAAPLSPIVVNEGIFDPKGIYFTDSCRNPLVMSDWFFWSTPDNMRELCSVYNDIDDFVLNKRVLCCGEEILTKKCDIMGLSKIPVKKSLYLIRDAEFKDRYFGRTF